MVHFGYILKEQPQQRSKIHLLIHLEPEHQSRDGSRQLITEQFDQTSLGDRTISTELFLQ